MIYFDNNFVSVFPFRYSRPWINDSNARRWHALTLARVELANQHRVLTVTLKAYKFTSGALRLQPEVAKRKLSKESSLIDVKVSCNAGHFRGTRCHRDWFLDYHRNPWGVSAPPLALYRSDVPRVSQQRCSRSQHDAQTYQSIS